MVVDVAFRCVCDLNNPYVLSVLRELGDGVFSVGYGEGVGVLFWSVYAFVVEFKIG